MLQGKRLWSYAIGVGPGGTTKPAVPFNMKKKS